MYRVCGMSNYRLNLHVVLPLTVGAVEMLAYNTSVFGATVVGVSTMIGYMTSKAAGMAFISPHIFKKQEKLINQFKSNLCREKIDSGEIMYSANDDAAPLYEQFQQYRDALPHDELADHIAGKACDNPTVLEQIRQVSRELKVAAAIAPLYGIAGGMVMHNVSHDAAKAVDKLSTESAQPKTEIKPSANTYIYSPK